MEEVGTPGDSRFEKMKLRWQVDYTNEDYRKRLIDAYNTGGEEAMLDMYGDIYQQEVFPAVNDRWKNGEA